MGGCPSKKFFLNKAIKALEIDSGNATMHM
jgi:hypothetical protein